MGGQQLLRRGWPAVWALRPVRQERQTRDCCPAPNLWSVQGDEPLWCTAPRSARTWAMGLDSSHMDYVCACGSGAAAGAVYGHSGSSRGPACANSNVRLVQHYHGNHLRRAAGTLSGAHSRRQMRHWLRGAGTGRAHRPGRGASLYTSAARARAIFGKLKTDKMESCDPPLRRAEAR